MQFKKIVSRLNKRLFRKISQQPYLGQQVDFQSTLKYFDLVNSLHTHKIKKSGIEDDTVIKIVSACRERFKDTIPLKIVDIGTGEGALIKKIENKIRLSQIDAVEPLEKYHDTVSFEKSDVKINWVTDIKSVDHYGKDFCTMIGVAAYMDDASFINTMHNIDKILKPGGLLFIRSVLKHTNPQLKTVSFRKLAFLNDNQNVAPSEYKTIRRTLYSELNLVANSLDNYKLQNVYHLAQDCFLHVWIKV